MGNGIAPRESAAPAQATSVDREVDVVVVGAGGGGFPAALYSRWLGNEVVVLEKAAEVGGTAKKAAFWYWVPNNEAMKSAGMADTKEDFLRYVARLSRPQAYDANDPKLGLSDWDYDLCEAIYDNASEATQQLSQKNVLPYIHCAAVPDYWSEIPEDKAPYGRVLLPDGARPTMSDGGEVAVRRFAEAAQRDGVDVLASHRVQRALTDPSGRVVGVEATRADGSRAAFRARKGVIFATGGFTHNVELRRNFLNVPVYGGCAAPTNEGDFVYIASALGAQLRNMNYAWMCPVSLEKAVKQDPSLIGMFSVAGDSMIWVNKTGRRMVNEKLQYNELAQTFFSWDGINCEYPNLVQIQVWDQRSQDHSASDEYGRLIVPPGEDDSHVIKGETLDELATNIGRRLERYESVTGGLRLSDDFADNLRQSIERFNGYARTGVDEEHHRGERPVQFLFNGNVKEEPDSPNVTMYPISESGPYYAALVAGGTLDTKGGPKTNRHGQVVNDQDEPIPGLYGVGNCVASASAQAYWAGGATLGPILAFAYLAAQAIDKESESRAPATQQAAVAG
ncbi:MAG TPA: FAD-dependent oxidoreductase [Candidatus Limnocylindria bacterium]|nr:FAD-dependent oxidoreductase [Candidatus Limnocylindria bacterium]